MKPLRAFTLIELLVVITVIILLAAIVLASLSGSKSQAKDAAVKTEISAIKQYAIQYYGIGNNYGVDGNTGSSASCTYAGSVFDDTSTNAAALTVSIQNAISTLVKNANGGGANVICRSTKTAFLITAQISNGDWWCADSSNQFSTGSDIGAAKPSGTSCS